MNKVLELYEYIIPEERNESRFAAVLALIVGLLATVLAGGSVNGELAEMLPMIAAVATPGVLAWVMTYLACSEEKESADIEDYEEKICYA